ncbi:MAG: flavodoxin family protein [Deltaproteobacteria bacterium]|nr:flavodoxin family protein [Deltaproteobacteria bacterium]
MEKKLMFICGSPREAGNTLTVVNWVASAAKEAGASVEIIRADQIGFKERGCIACMGCQKSEHYRCVIKDEASSIVARFPEQDAIIFASPVYFMGLSGQIKILIDRMYSLFKITQDGKQINHPMQNTSFSLIVTSAGAAEHGLNLVTEHVKAIAGFFGKDLKTLAIPHAPIKPGTIVSNSKILESALKFGKELVG